MLFPAVHFSHSAWAGLLVALFLLVPLTGCDSTGMEPDETSQFEATFRGAFNADLKGGAAYRTFEGDALLDVFTNVSLLLTDDNRRSDRAIYFTRRDTSALTVGTYSLVDLVSADDATKRNPKRVWAYIFGGRDDGYADGFAYSRGGELRIEEATAERLRGTFAFPVTALSDTAQTNVTVVEGTFESVRR